MTETVSMEQWKRDVADLARAEVRAALGEQPARRAMPVTIAKGLVAAQRAVKAVSHDGFNAHHKYAYTSAEALVSEARGALNGAGLALLEVHHRAHRGETYELEVAYLLVHEGGDTYELEPVRVPVLVGQGRTDDKAQAAALTYCLGYTVRGLLLIPRPDSDEDVDQRDDRGHQQHRGGGREERHEQRAAEQQPPPRNGNGGAAKTLDQCTNADELLAACARGRSNASKYVGPAREKAIAVVRQHAERLKVPVERALDAAGLLEEPGARADG